QYELKGRKEALAFVEGNVDHVLELLGGNQTGTSCEEGVANDRHKRLQAELEVSEPTALVGECQQAISLYPLVLGYANVEQTGAIDGAQNLLPGEIQAVLAPTPAQLDYDLGICRAVESPVIGADEFFQQIYWIVAALWSASGNDGHTAPNRWPKLGFPS